MAPEGSSEAERRGYNPAPQHRLWRDVLLPRSIVPLFWVAWLLLLPARAVGSPARRRRRGQPTLVGVESGRIGWTQVFFEELIGSARDYVGADGVVQQVIDRDLPYLPQFAANQRRDDPTHLVLDVRTPGQSWRRSLVEGFVVSWRILIAGRTPVVVLTDAFYRRQRWQSAVLTCYHGVVITFAPREVMKPLFPHRRVIGPLPMPISCSRLDWLESVAAEYPHDGSSVQFIGNVYPPRSDFLDVVGSRLAERGITLTVNGSKTASNEAYWRTLAEADVVVTTCMQGPSRPFMDWIWEQQLVFRYNETLAAGAALVASKVEGSARFFEPGRDFLEFVSVDEAVDAIESLVRDEERRRTVASTGHAAAVRIIRGHRFWVEADSRLVHRMVAPA
jgi:hypothetical protein